MKQTIVSDATAASPGQAAAEYQSEQQLWNEIEHLKDSSLEQERLEFGRLFRALRQLYAAPGRKGLGFQQVVSSKGFHVRTVNRWIKQYETEVLHQPETLGHKPSDTVSQGSSQPHDTEEVSTSDDRNFSCDSARKTFQPVAGHGFPKLPAHLCTDYVPSPTTSAEMHNQQDDASTPATNTAPPTRTGSSPAWDSRSASDRINEGYRLLHKIFQFVRQPALDQELAAIVDKLRQDRVLADSTYRPQAGLGKQNKYVNTVEEMIAKNERESPWN
jgi:hypothetical protein